MKIRNDIVLWGNFYGFIVMGMIVLSFGSLMPFIRESYVLTYEQGGLLLALFAAGNLIVGFLGGTLSDLLGNKKILVLGNAFYVIGLLVIAISTHTYLLYIGVFITGAGWGTCNTGINLMVNNYVQGDGKIMSLLHMTFGFGAVSIPIISSFLIRLGLSWKSVMVLLAVFAFIGLLIILKMPVHTDKKADNNVPKFNKEVFKNGRLYVLMAILFFYVGSESAFNGWIVTYLISGLDFSEALAQNVLSILWVVIILGRYMNSILSQKFRKENLILASSFGSLIMVICFVNVKAPIMVILVVALLGIMFSGIYPLTMANANPIVKGSGTASAMITSFGGLGAAVIPYISGKVAEKSGVMGMIMTILIALIFLTLFAGINRRTQRLNI